MCMSARHLLTNYLQPEPFAEPTERPDIYYYKRCDFLILWSVTYIWVWITAIIVWKYMYIFEKIAPAGSAFGLADDSRSASSRRDTTRHFASTVGVAYPLNGLIFSMIRPKMVPDWAFRRARFDFLLMSRLCLLVYSRPGRYTREVDGSCLPYEYISRLRCPDYLSTILPHTTRLRYIQSTLLQCQLYLHVWHYGLHVHSDTLLDNHNFEDWHTVKLEIL